MRLCLERPLCRIVLIADFVNPFLSQSYNFQATSHPLPLSLLSLF